MATPKICVVGACNTDLVSFAPRLPRWGETLRGTKFHMGFGGKGANQAVMAAKLGAQVSMVAKVGNDIFGENTSRNMQSFGIDTTHIHTTNAAFSGVAPIAVDPDGRNAIIVVTGANDLLSVEEVQQARPAIAAADILICQLEIPLEVTLAALRIGNEEGVTTIFNPAPARDDIPDEALPLSTIFCPNESETELITGMPACSQAEAEAAAQTLRRRGAETVILTLGERGSLVVSADGAIHVPVEKVKAVDTTGAGDAFVGALAYFIGVGLALAEAVRRANRVAAVSVQGVGTQTSFPSRSDLPEDLFA
jgi:ribokinase